MTHIPLLIGAVILETIVIQTFAKRPKPDWFHAGAASGTANILAWMTSLFVNPIILTLLASNLPRELHRVEPWVAWFCAFTIGNALELATVQWVWRIPVTKTMGIIISLANLLQAATEIHQLFHDT